MDKCLEYVGQKCSEDIKMQVTHSVLNCNDKPFVALDLDYTVKSNYTAPPYQSPPEYGEFRVQIPPFIRCRQKNCLLASKCLELFADVRDILEWCTLYKVKITICSRSPDRNLVEKVLKTFNMWNLFEHPQIFDATKGKHFSNLQNDHGVQFNNVVFFDDIKSNISIASSLGITSCLVDRREGLTWSVFLKGMMQYFARARSRSALRNWLVPSHNSSDCNGSNSSSRDDGDSVPSKKRKLEDREGFMIITSKESHNMLSDNASLLSINNCLATEAGQFYP